MVAINKYLAIAVIASVLLAAFVQAEDNGTETAAPGGIAGLPGMMGGLGHKIISGLENAGNTVMSNIPFVGGASNGNSTEPAAEAATEQPAAGTEQPAAAAEEKKQ